MMKKYMILAMVFLLAGCSDEKKLIEALESLVRECHSEVVVKVRLGSWGNYMEVICADYREEEDQDAN